MEPTFPTRMRSTPSPLSHLHRAILSAVLAVFVFAQPARAFVFDSFGDGVWKIVNRSNGNSLLVTATGASQSGGTATQIEKEFQVLYNIESDTFRLRNHDTWQCIEAQGAGTSVGTAVVENAGYTAAAHQRWKLVDVGGGDYRIVNAPGNLAIQTDAATPANVTLAAASTDPRQYWRFEYQTHYPKKGSAGYENDWSRYKVGWNYSWGKFTNPATPPQVVFEPMQHNRWWEGAPENLAADSAGFRASAKPVYMLGFNEPDHTDQANMTVAEVIALWPYFQNAKLPLVSPVAASAYGGWLGDFYNQVAANGYRVDFTAVHWYGAPDASSLINHLQSVYNTWGRPIWLTEFANIDWDNNEYWSEEDSYRFMAEFLWRAEDLLWLKRYSIFSMAGDPPPNPWDHWGDNSNMFYSNGSTFTAFGELYAAWDGDRTIRARQPYLIHNQGAAHRMTSSGATTPGTAWIRESGATAQWTLIASPTASRYYIQSLNNGRRLRYNGTVLDLALPGTTGADLEWSLNAAGDGYYYIDLPSRSKTLQMNRTNDGNGAPTSLGVTVVNNGTPNESTRFRFIKPYAPLRVTGGEARYDFEGNVTDASGEGNHGAVFGTGVTYVAGKVGAQAAQFDGTASYVRIPSPVQTDFSIACWIKTTSTAPAGAQWWSGNGIVDGEVAGAAEDFGLALLGNKVAFGAGNPDATVISSAVVNDGLWHHVCATRTRAGVLGLYVDGTSQGTANGPSWDRFASTLLRIGGRQSGGNFFNGAIDDLRIFNYVVPGSNVTALIAAVAAPWQSVDVGGPSVEGYSSTNGTTWTVGGSGSDIWNASDQFHLHAQTFAGDGSIVARITSLPTNTDGTITANAKAGLMFRASTATDAPFVMLAYDHSQGIQLLYRGTAGTAAAQQGASFAVSAAPFWLKLARSGNTFTAYRATTAGTPAPADWILAGSRTATLPASALAGLATTSHDNGLLARAGFASVTLAPPNTAPTLSNVAGQTLSENSATAVLPVTLGDAETAPASLALSAVSSNQTLVPNAAIALGGSGANRTVTVTPAANQTGSATITLTVSDGELTAADTFAVNVQLSPGGAWRQTHFGTMSNTGSAADTADPDNDGCNNLLERALNGNPNTGGTLTQPGTATGALAIAFTRATTATDLILTAQAADTPAGPWTDLARSTAGAAFTVLETGATATETGGGATRSVEVRDLFPTGDPAHPRRFLRVQVQR